MQRTNNLASTYLFAQPLLLVLIPSFTSIIMPILFAGINMPTCFAGINMPTCFAGPGY
jgi:hypothetical protein